MCNVIFGHRKISLYRLSRWWIFEFYSRRIGKKKSYIIRVFEEASVVKFFLTGFNYMFTLTFAKYHTDSMVVRRNEYDFCFPSKINMLRRLLHDIILHTTTFEHLSFFSGCDDSFEPLRTAKIRRCLFVTWKILLINNA